MRARRRVAGGTPSYRRRLAALVLLAPLAAACGGGNTQVVADSRVALSAASGSAGNIEVREAYIPAPPGAAYAPGAGFAVEMVLVNNGDAWDSFVSGSSPTAGRVRFAVGNVTQDFLAVPNDGQPIEGEVQVSGLTRPVAPGQDVSITLRLQSGSDLNLDVPVHRPPPRGTGT